ncbi:hypothetical protein FRB95_008945 [Tulasnella sp. JGI-2019a]|nr:hypothetical protein FRB95_008945 [Tulasnella sp. JGI-2019a]
MESPGDKKINQAITTVLEAVQEVCAPKTHSMDGRQDLLNEIDALETCLEKFTSKMYHVIANRRQRYNANLPIHQLPPELISRILALAMSTSSFGSSKIVYMQRLRKLASV